MSAPAASREQPAFLRELAGRQRVRERSNGWETSCPDHGGFPVVIYADHAVGRYRFVCAEAENGDLCGHEGNLLRLLGISETDLSLDESEPAGLRTRGVMLERVRPICWLWSRRIPVGSPSLIVGEEGVGKGTFCSWLIARATCGELDGDLAGQPVRVL
ncbi:MAG TPA: hypothetical protein VKA61_08590, partial [Sphingomicrobium sp.]|nr:hypothetical protein [Sphingomicrobium sp.]